MKPGPCCAHLKDLIGAVHPPIRNLSGVRCLFRAERTHDQVITRIEAKGVRLDRPPDAVLVQDLDHFLILDRPR